MRRLISFFVLIPVALCLAGCLSDPDPQDERPQTYPGAADGPGGQEDGLPVDFAAESDAEPDGDAWRIQVVSAAGEELWSFTEAGLSLLPVEQAESFSHIYSTVNNWPAASYYAADGYSVRGILKAAGVHDTIQMITFRAADGYEVSLTRDQLFSQQYYFPHVGEDDGMAEPVLPVIAFRWREGTDDIYGVREDKPCFIFGQRTPSEHTNPAFVVGVTEIIVDDGQCAQWPPATTFPDEGTIGDGETVKLQHPFFGLVKMYYTLDGSEPTMCSPMYNPSTYQTELNKPIPVAEPVTIKVLVTGYGRNDSEIAVFEFWPEGTAN